MREVSPYDFPPDQSQFTHFTCCLHTPPPEECWLLLFPTPYCFHCCTENCAPQQFSQRSLGAMTWVGRGKAGQGRRKPPSLVLRRYLRNGPVILAVGLHALPSRAFAGPSNSILSLSHIGYLLIKDKLGSSQISRSHRQVTCVSLPLFTHLSPSRQKQLCLPVNLKSPTLTWWCLGTCSLSCSSDLDSLPLFLTLPYHFCSQLLCAKQRMLPTRH